MRVNGRTLRPSNLAERRLLLSLGAPAVRVPRKINPYLAARRLSRLANGSNADLLFARELIAGPGPRKMPKPIEPTPDIDLPVGPDPDAPTHAG